MAQTSPYKGIKLKQAAEPPQKHWLQWPSPLRPQREAMERTLTSSRNRCTSGTRIRMLHWAVFNSVGPTWLAKTKTSQRESQTAQLNSLLIRITLALFPKVQSESLTGHSSRSLQRHQSNSRSVFDIFQKVPPSWIHRALINSEKTFTSGRINSLPKQHQARVLSICTGTLAWCGLYQEIQHNPIIKGSGRTWPN